MEKKNLVLHQIVIQTHLSLYCLRHRSPIDALLYYFEITPLLLESTRY